MSHPQQGRLNKVSPLMSSLYKEKFRTEVFIAVLLVYIAKTLQFVVVMVAFILFYR